MSHGNAGSSRPPERAVGAVGGVRKELPRQDEKEPAHWRKKRRKRAYRGRERIEGYEKGTRQ